MAVIDCDVWPAVSWSTNPTWWSSTPATNEFVDRKAVELGSGPGALPDAVNRTRRLALFRLPMRLLAPLRPPAVSPSNSIFGIDVQRQEMGRVSSAEVAAAARRLQANLESIAHTIRSGGAIPVLCTVASNLADWRPENSAMSSDLDPGSVLAIATHRARGHDLVNRGDNQGAATEFEAAVTLDPGYAAAAFDAAKLQRRLGHSDTAYRLFATARDHDPTPIRAPSAFNAAVREAARSTGALLADVEPAIDRAADDTIPGKDLFLDYCHPTAAGHRTIARVLQTTLEAELDLAVDRSGVVEDGTDTAVATDHPDEGFALWWRGNVELRQGRSRSAERLLRRSVELKPNTARPLVSLAQALRDQGRTDEALQVALRAVEVSPDSVMALSFAGVLLGRTGRREQAVDILNRALEVDPSAAYVHVNLGAEYLRLRQPDKALEHLEEAVRLHPNLGGAYRNIGLARLLVGDDRAAAEAFVEELRRNPFDTTAALRLCESATEIGSPAIANGALELAQTLAPDSPRVRDAAERVPVCGR